jgi:biotin carboxyl carrier protein
MKLNVKINNKTYSVEIEDLNARPIVAIVDGERFDVMPENSEQPKATREASAAAVSAPKQVSTPTVSANEKALLSPLPGTVTEVFVKVGDEVESGQVLLVIEAMKMKNSIRSVRDGIVAAVLATSGQTVNHKQPLVEFE